MDDAVSGREPVEARFEVPYFEEPEQGPRPHAAPGFIWGAVGGAVAFLIMWAAAG